MQSYINSLGTNMDASSGPIKDLAIDPQAIQLSKLEQLISYASMLMSLGSSAQILPADLDAFANDFGVTRGIGSYAQGTLVFERSSAPTSDITIPASTTVTVPGTVLGFMTTAPVTMYASLASSYYNALRNRWGIAAPAIAQQPGKDYNISAGKSLNLASSISGIAFCYNPGDFYGGLDIPTNTELAQRLANVLGGTDRSSKSGVSAEILRVFPEVVDVAVLQGQDPLITRIAKNIPQDIFVTGETSQQYSDSLTFAGTSQTSYVFQSQPVLEISGVFNSSTGTPYTEGTDYLLIKDTGSVSGSIQAADAISFPGTTSIPPSTPLTIVYSVNQTVVNIQTYYDKESHSILGIDTLVREGIKVPLYLTIRLSVLPGYDVHMVKDNITQFLSSYFNTQQFGDGRTPTSPDDTRLQILNNIDGISVFLWTQFSRTGTPGEIISFILNTNEYAVFDSTLLNWV
jgi:hypothetical protein